MKFENMNLNHSILHGLKNMGMVNPTEIQEKAIPAIIDNPNTHFIAQARTGSGKTLAFAIPIAEKIEIKKQEVQCVIIVPTRELCKQVAEVFTELARYHRVKVVQVYGGVSIENQMDAIRNGAQIIVATPGRLIDIYHRNQVSFNEVKFVVLDEADRCLDMGFMPDIEFLLLEAMSNIHPRLMLFSATMFDAVMDLTTRFTQGKNVIEINISEDEVTVENCDQYYYVIDDFRDKYYHFLRIIRSEKPKHSMIFVNTKKTGDWLYNRFLDEKNFPLKPELISGNLSQRRRELVLDKFRKRKINCLIATDVAARGLDIEKVSHVFNYDLPEFEEVYIHRIGRTARVSGTSANVEKGTAITLAMKDQVRIISRIEGITNKEISKRNLPQRRQMDDNFRNNDSSRESHYRRQHSPLSSYPKKEGGYRGKKGEFTPKSKESKKSAEPNRKNYLY